MIISHKHKFITIDVPKTGTTSINNQLRPYLDKGDFTFVMSGEIGMRHSTYNEVITKFPNYKNYFSFAFVRNPWDRMLSFWFFKKQHAVNKIPQNTSLKDFFSQDKLFKNELFLDQYSFVKDFGEKSFIGRFENLQEDFDAVCDKIGLPRKTLLHKNKTKHRHYTEYYDDETREIIAEKYARDIDYFGYKFGE